MSGFADLIASTRAATASATMTSLAPFARTMLTPTTGAPIEPGECARLGNRVGDEAEIVQPHLAPGRQRDSRGCEIGDRLGPGKGTDGLVATANLGPPAGEIDVAPAKLPADIERGQARRLQPNRIEPYPNLALDATDALDAATPRTPCSPRMTTSSTNQESCSGVFPGAIAA